MDFHVLDPMGPVLLTPRIFSDKRGYFMETFRQSDFEAHCGKYQFVQDNQSKSVQHVLRGLHYQLIHPQGKLVRVFKGQIIDAAIDLRQFSPNFGKFYLVQLDDEKCQSLWIPPGFAHGFYVKSPVAEFVYKCTAYYDPDDEYCIIWNDPDLNIPWPIKEPPILSDKDLKGCHFKEAQIYS